MEKWLPSWSIVTRRELIDVVVMFEVNLILLCCAFVFNKIMQRILLVRPGNKNIVNISVIGKRFVWTARQKVFFSTAMKILTQHGATLVPMAVPHTCRKYSPIKVKTLCSNINVIS